MFVGLRACSSGPGTVHTIIPCCSFGTVHKLVCMFQCFTNYGVFSLWVWQPCCAAVAEDLCPRSDCFTFTSHSPLLLLPNAHYWSVCFLILLRLFPIFMSVHGWTPSSHRMGNRSNKYCWMLSTVLIAFFCIIFQTLPASLCVCCVNTAFCVYFWYFYY